MLNAMLIDSSWSLIFLNSHICSEHEDWLTSIVDANRDKDDKIKVRGEEMELL